MGNETFTDKDLEEISSFLHIMEWGKLRVVSVGIAQAENKPRTARLTVTKRPVDGLEFRMLGLGAEVFTGPFPSPYEALSSFRIRCLQSLRYTIKVILDCGDSSEETRLLFEKVRTI